MDAIPVLGVKGGRAACRSRWGLFCEPGHVLCELVSCGQIAPVCVKPSSSREMGGGVRRSLRSFPALQPVLPTWIPQLLSCLSFQGTLSP